MSIATVADLISALSECDPNLPIGIAVHEAVDDYTNLAQIAIRQYHGERAIIYAVSVNNSNFDDPKDGSVREYDPHSIKLLVYDKYVDWKMIAKEATEIER